MIRPIPMLLANNEHRETQNLYSFQIIGVRVRDYPGNTQDEIPGTLKISFNDGALVDAVPFMLYEFDAPTNVRLINESGENSDLYITVVVSTNQTMRYQFPQEMIPIRAIKPLGDLTLTTTNASIVSELLSGSYPNTTNLSPTDFTGEVLMITNRDSSNVVRVGDGSISATKGIPILPEQTLSIRYKGYMYGRTESGTAVVNVSRCTG